MVKPTCPLLILRATSTHFPSWQNLQDLPGVSPSMPLSGLAMPRHPREGLLVPGTRSGQGRSTESPVTRACKYSLVQPLLT